MSNVIVLFSSFNRNALLLRSKSDSTSTVELYPTAYLGKINVPNSLLGSFLSVTYKPTS